MIEVAVHVLVAQHVNIKETARTRPEAETRLGRVRVLDAHGDDFVTHSLLLWFSCLKY